MYKWLFLLAFTVGCNNQVVQHKPVVDSSYEVKVPFILKKAENKTLVFENGSSISVLRGFHLKKTVIGGVYYFTKKDGMIKSIRFVGELAPLPRDSHEKN